MTERQIGHRKSSLVLSVLFSVVKWRSCSLAKSAYYIVLLACLSRLRVWARGDTWIQTSSLPFLSIQATAGSRPFLWLLFPSALFLSYSWKFFPNIAHSHWVLRGHMTSNNETVSRQNLWAENSTKCMTSQDNSALFFLRGLYNRSLKVWSLGKHLILFPSNFIEVLGKQN